MTTQSPRQAARVIIERSDYPDGVSEYDLAADTVARALVEIEPAKLLRAAEVIDMAVAPDRSMLAEELRRYAAILGGSAPPTAEEETTT